MLLNNLNNLKVQVSSDGKVRFGIAILSSEATYAMKLKVDSNVVAKFKNGEASVKDVLNHVISKSKRLQARKITSVSVLPKAIKIKDDATKRFYNCQIVVNV